MVYCEISILFIVSECEVFPMVTYWTIFVLPPFQVENEGAIPANPTSTRNLPLYSTFTSGLSEPAILIELSSPFSLLCLAPIDVVLINYTCFFQFLYQYLHHFRSSPYPLFVHTSSYF